MQQRCEKDRLLVKLRREEQFRRNQARLDFEADLTRILLAQQELSKDQKMLLNFYKPASKDDEDESVLPKEGHVEKLQSIRCFWRGEEEKAKRHFEARQKIVNSRISTHQIKKRVRIDRHNHRNHARLERVHLRHSRILEDQQQARDRAYSTIMRKLVRS